MDNFYTMIDKIFVDERKKMVEDTEDTIFYIIDRYFAFITGDMKDEITIIGYTALVDAALTYDPTESINFKVYAFTNIYRKIKKFLKDKNYLV